MTKLRAILAAAAIAIGGGAVIGVAMQDASIAEGVESCEDWARTVAASTPNTYVTWFVQVRSGYRAPPSVGEQIIGERDGNVLRGVFTAIREDCGTGLEYGYVRSAVAQGSMVYRFDGDPMFREAWQSLALADADVDYLGGWYALDDNCAAVANQARCNVMLGGISECSRLPNGNLCRYGLEYGPGLGGVHSDGTPATCTPSGKPFPCRDLGRGKHWATRATTEDPDAPVVD